MATLDILEVLEEYFLSPWLVKTFTGQDVFSQLTIAIILGSSFEINQQITKMCFYSLFLLTLKEICLPDIHLLGQSEDL